MPNRNLPLENLSSVAICLACIKGLCSGTRLMAVPSLMVLVAAAAIDRAMSGSPMSAIEGGMDPSGVPP